MCRVSSMEPEGILNAWITAYMMTAARMIAEKEVSTHSRSSAKSREAPSSLSCCQAWKSPQASPITAPVMGHFGDGPCKSTEALTTKPIKEKTAATKTTCRAETNHRC